MNTTRDIQTSTPRSEPVYVPVTRIAEESGKLQLLIDLPGVAEKDLALSLDKNLLTVRARMALAGVEGRKPGWSEFQPGTFEREFRLGEELDPATIQAVLKHGVLRIEFAKRDLVRRIPVRAG